MAFDASMLQGFALSGWKWFVFIVGGLCFGVLCYIGAVWYNKKKRYVWSVNIYSIGKDGRPKLKEYDVAAILMDKKTQNRLFMLKNNAVALSPDNIPYTEGPKESKIVNILQLGLKQFRYLDRPVLQQNSPLVLAYGVGDEDVAWAINSIDHAKMYEKKNLLDKLIPFLGMAFVFITVVVALYFLFVKAGFNADLLRQLAQTSMDISKNLAAASSGTTVVSSG